MSSFREILLKFGSGKCLACGEVIPEKARFCPLCGAPTNRPQNDVVWIPEAPPPKRMVSVPKKPVTVWTLFRETDPNKIPSLPIHPHRGIAFPEDELHDWAWKNGRLRYFSRLNEGGVWVLLEY